ncbi:PREDICTED: carboxypeptidase B-like [Papilio polytes]|uniref:carboxypeptidase B-like n=1 Tax=Papilio polytes TaxID=76194 RepID=UPI00067651B7|nr:PREDICTED: carboxypeptidase B-like [Papilio polytes]
MYKFVFLLALSIGLALAKHEEYDGSLVYQVKVSNVEQAQQIYALENKLGLDMWSYAAPSSPGLVLVPGPMRQRFQTEVAALGAQYELQIQNVKEAIELEEKLLATAASRNSSRSGRLTLDKIHRYAEINAYLDELAEKYETVTVESAGKSFEGRDIRYLKISTSKFEDLSKPVVVVQSMLHAREWVTLPAALYAIEKLVVDISDRDLVDKIDWIIIPIANPDGYEFSHTNTRFWRKNRSTGHIIGNLCQGVDLNRNFDINFGSLSSSNPCSETFHGPGPFSEPESLAIRNIVLGNMNRIELYLDIHSFGSLILYGYGNGDLPANALTLNVVGVRMAQAIDAVKWESKPNYRVGNVALILYRVSGSAPDYVQAIGIPLAYTYELPAYRNQNNSLNGFLVDPDFIEQAGVETWEGIKAGAKWVLQNTRRK